MKVTRPCHNRDINLGQTLLAFPRIAFTMVAHENQVGADYYFAQHSGVVRRLLFLSMAGGG
jgi:hypothetical protein